MRGLYFILLICLCLVVEGYPSVSAVDQFSAEFTLTAQWNASFTDRDIYGYIPIPFLQSPTVMPFRGKIWFNYPTAEFRIDLFNGDGSPWKLATSIIAHSSNFTPTTPYSFNCTTDFYMTAGLNRCWYVDVQNINLPYQMGGSMNLTYNGTKVVDGYDCMVFESNTGIFIDVRLMDLAIVEIDLPYLIGELAPYFNFFGNGGFLSRISLFNIVTGPPDPSNFNIPAGNCIQVWNESTPVDYSKVDVPIIELITAPLREMSKVFKSFHRESPKDQEPILKKRDFQQQHPPPLNQTYSAKWLLNAPAPNAPFTPYSMAGTLGFDFTLSGFYITLDTITGNVPIDLQFSVRIYPDRNGIEFLQVGPDGSCYSYLYLQWLWTYLIPVFEVPYDANYIGNVIINGDSTTAWQTTWNWRTYWAELYVRDKDHVLVQSIIPDPFSLTPCPLTFTDITGAVPPSTYSRPDCAELMNWSPNFASHLPWAWCFPFC